MLPGVSRIEEIDLTGHSSKLQWGSTALVDSDLLPVVAMLPGVSRIEEIDLSGNTALTEKSLHPLVEKLFGKAASCSLRNLNLQQCLSNSSRSGARIVMELVVRLIGEDNGARFLQKIDLGGIAMDIRTHLPLCQAIRQHSYLTSVTLSDVGMRGRVAYQCVDELGQ